MNNVIEIRDSEDWNTMSCLRGSLTFYQENNSTGKYSKAMEREGHAYDSYLNKYIPKHTFH